jgi:hypothetical protein
LGVFFGGASWIFPHTFCRKEKKLSCSKFSFPPTISQETKTGKRFMEPWTLCFVVAKGFRVLFFWHLINGDIIGFEEMIKSCSCCQPHGSNVNLFLKTAFTLLNKDC